MSTLAVVFIVFLVGVPAMGAVIWTLTRCPHGSELYDRYPDGRPALRCMRCLRLRPNILMAAVPGYHLTQSGGPIARPETGIDRVWAELDHPITDAELFDLVPQ